MAPVVTPERPQHLKALDLANETRMAAVAIKRDLKAGRLTIAQALHDPRADCLTVLDLLMAQRRWGRQRAVKTLVPQFISETKRVRDLTDRQRRLLGEACL